MREGEREREKERERKKEREKEGEREQMEKGVKGKRCSSEISGCFPL